MQKTIPITGLELGVAKAGLKRKNKADLLLIRLKKGSQVAGVFTTNKFRAAPVEIASNNLARGGVRALVVNTGVANAGTGKVGLSDAKKVCEKVGNMLKINTTEVLPFSTGVIMERLPAAQIIEALPNAVDDLREDNWFRASEAILTTDTVTKSVSMQIEVDGTSITITGIAKGSGMIKPDMATMLSFIATDARIDATALNEMIDSVVKKSFNCITVDGDTSTNDSFLLMATCQSGNFIVKNKNEDLYEVIRNAIEKVAVKLAKMIIKDGEGATKFVTIKVKTGQDEKECRAVAFSIAESPLVKTAFYAEDPNLGRILAAIGKSDVKKLNLQNIIIHLDSMVIFENGERAVGYDEKKASTIMKKDEFCLIINLARGEEEFELWTCDMSHDYVTINSDYRS